MKRAGLRETVSKRPTVYARLIDKQKHTQPCHECYERPPFSRQHTHRLLLLLFCMLLGSKQLWQPDQPFWCCGLVARRDMRLQHACCCNQLTTAPPGESAISLCASCSTAVAAEPTPLAVLGCPASMHEATMRYASAGQYKLVVLSCQQELHAKFDDLNPDKVKSRVA